MMTRTGLRVFAATGKRLRSLPFDRKRWREVLRVDTSMMTCRR
jgi:hypothetical protein